MKENNTNLSNNYSTRQLKIAVIIPVFNTEKYLAECLDSLLNQSYSNFIAYIIDDGSTDSSGKIIDAYVRKDSRIIAIHQSNKGVSAARNVALNLICSNSSIDIVCLLDSDDILTPQSFQTLATTFHKHKVDFVLAGYVGFNKKGIIPNHKKIDHAPLELEGKEIFDFVLGSDKYFKRSSPAFSVFIGNYYFSPHLINEIRFDESKQTCEDQDFRFRTLLNAKKGVAISDITFLYRSRKSSLSHSGFRATDDINMLNSWFKLYPTISDDIKPSIETFAITCWWSSLRRAAALNLLDCTYTEFSKCLTTMRKIFISEALENPKVKKRLFLFSLGKTPLKLYLSFQGNFLDKKLADSFE